MATGETIFKVLPVDPDAATKPRHAIGPGRYVLGDSVHLAVPQVTSVERFGAPEVRTKSAKILFLSPAPKVPSPHEPYEIHLPDGLANYAILWARNSGQLFVVEPGSVRTIDFTNPADVKETRSKRDLAPEYRMLIPERSASSDPVKSGEAKRRLFGPSSGKQVPGTSAGTFVSRIENRSIKNWFFGSRCQAPKVWSTCSNSVCRCGQVCRFFAV